MSSFPHKIGEAEFESLDQLVAFLDFIGTANALENPGQFFPADRFASLPEDQKAVVGEAASKLIATATHPGAILVCAMTGRWNRATWHAALLDRLEKGPAIPDVPGTQGQTLMEELTETFAFGALDDATKTRARAVLPSHTPLSSWIQFAVVHGSSMELAIALEDALESADPPVAMVTYGIGRLAHKDPNQLMMLVPALAKLNTQQCTGIDGAVKLYAPAWHAQSGDAFRRGMGL